MQGGEKVLKFGEDRYGQEFRVLFMMTHDVKRRLVPTKFWLLLT